MDLAGQPHASGSVWETKIPSNFLTHSRWQIICHPVHSNTQSDLPKERFHTSDINPSLSKSSWRSNGTTTPQPYLGVLFKLCFQFGLALCPNCVRQRNVLACFHLPGFMALLNNFPFLAADLNSTDTLLN